MSDQAKRDLDHDIREVQRARDRECAPSTAGRRTVIVACVPAACVRVLVLVLVLVMVH